MSRHKILTRACLIALALCASAAEARPVVYTLRTVLDGQLGSLKFNQAVATITLAGDTRNVQSHRDAAGHLIYTNREGRATIAVTVSGTTTTATFAPGEIYARYDTATGIAGFGSAIGATYPVALGCSEYSNPATTTADCTQGYWGTAYTWIPGPTYWENGQRHGTLTGNADVAANPPDASNSSAAALALPQSLSQSTLLTGPMHSCAGLYTFLDTDGDLDQCTAVAARGLRTSLGDLFLQDLRDSHLLGNTYNMGALRVEVQIDE